MIAMAAIVLITSCGKDDESEPSALAPKVVSSSPVADAEDVALDTSIEITFDKDMNSLTINATTFTLLEGTSAVEGTVSYADSVATFTPTSNLTASTLYTAAITVGAKDMEGVALANIHTFSFTSGLAPAVAAPTVVTTTPLNEATDVALNMAISIKFSEAMDPSTITSTSFTLKQGTTAVAGTVTYADSVAIFTPTSDLAASILYTATLSVDAKNMEGVALENIHTFSFTSGLAPVLVAPTVAAIAPLNEATDVALNITVSATFSEAMDPSTVTSTSFTLTQGTTAVAGTVTYAGNIAVFTPTSALEPGLTYSANVTVGAKNLAGTALAEAKAWSFTTNAIPTIISTAPLDAALNVALSQAISITFSEAMDPSTFTATSFTLMQGTTAVAGAVSYTGNTAVFTPTTALAAGSVFTATVTTDAKDLGGVAIAAAKVWSFTTDFLPTVTASNPANAATGVALNKVLSVTFNETMDASTITSSSFTLKQGATAIAGAISYSGMTGQFIPNSLLESNKIYTATVTTDAKNTTGSALAAAHVWTFTTGTVSGLAAVSLGASGNYVILAKTAINNIPTSAITGDLGLSPAATSFITGFALTDATGFATSPQVTGKVYAADMASPTSTNLTVAVENMITAYNDAAGRPTPDFSELGTGNIGGQTLAAGLYKWTSTVTVPSDVTISGGPDDVWIFQISGDLTMSAAKNITLTGGAQAKNIFWQVAGEVVIGTNAHFEGIVLSMTGITLQTGASLNGRMLAQTAVILDGNAVVKP